jgi:hypothetical protein
MKDFILGESSENVLVNLKNSESDRGEEDMAKVNYGSHFLSSLLRNVLTKACHFAFAGRCIPALTM